MLTQGACSRSYVSCDKVASCPPSPVCKHTLISVRHPSGYKRSSGFVRMSIPPGRPPHPFLQSFPLKDRRPGAARALYRLPPELPPRVLALSLSRPGRSGLEPSALFTQRRGRGILRTSPLRSFYEVQQVFRSRALEIVLRGSGLFSVLRLGGISEHASAHSTSTKRIG